MKNYRVMGDVVVVVVEGGVLVVECVLVVEGVVEGVVVEAVVEGVVVVEAVVVVVVVIVIVVVVVVFVVVVTTTVLQFLKILQSRASVNLGRLHLSRGHRL